MMLLTCMTWAAWFYIMWHHQHSDPLPAWQRQHAIEDAGGASRLLMLPGNSMIDYAGLRPVMEIGCSLCCAQVTNQDHGCYFHLFFCKLTWMDCGCPTMLQPVLRRPSSLHACLSCMLRINASVQIALESSARPVCVSTPAFIKIKNPGTLACRATSTDCCPADTAKIKTEQHTINLTVAD